MIEIARGCAHEKEKVPATGPMAAIGYAPSHAYDKPSPRRLTCPSSTPLGINVFAGKRGLNQAGKKSRSSTLPRRAGPQQNPPAFQLWLMPSG